MDPIEYLHVDVFTPRAYAGNSLPVFIEPDGLDAGQMLAITQELRHFESVFIQSAGRPNLYRARIFDLITELPFAGHPIIGAAAALHHTSSAGSDADWTFELAQRTVTVATTRTPSGFAATLDQGPAILGGTCANRAEIAQAFDLREDDIDPALPIEVISTGLSYLIVPVVSGALERARITHDITDLVSSVGAQFAVLLDEDALEIRHWNNDGIVEDIATGSAAGTVGAYRLRHCGARSGETFTLDQGRFVGRPSRIEVQPNGVPNAIHSVKVGGNVAIVGRGVLEARP